MIENSLGWCENIQNKRKLGIFSYFTYEDYPYDSLKLFVFTLTIICVYNGNLEYKHTALYILAMMFASLMLKRRQKRKRKEKKKLTKKIKEKEIEKWNL